MSLRVNELDRGAPLLSDQVRTEKEPHVCEEALRTSSRELAEGRVLTVLRLPDVEDDGLGIGDFDRAPVGGEANEPEVLFEMVDEFLGPEDELREEEEGIVVDGHAVDLEGFDLLLSRDVREAAEEYYAKRGQQLNSFMQKHARSILTNVAALGAMHQANLGCTTSQYAFAVGAHTLANKIADTRLGSGCTWLFGKVTGGLTAGTYALFSVGKERWQSENASYAPTLVNTLAGLAKDWNAE